ncbi:MAG: Glutamine--fructose-6-phosphate aminotransferase (isomerizing) [Chloroflexi bacterium ADurb.Bin180]|nr:MAG: Glutamine--fructose-6-phosphate aminotransferase (isomerizing) [Chloroflexi bacterium ADurb.Bin180]
MAIYAEILEQPHRLERLLQDQRATVERIAAEIRDRGIELAFLAARGASNNAARYANYLFGARNRLTVALATPSLFTCYKSPPRIKNALVIGLSQSGRSPDVVSVLAEGRKQGNPTLAITNEPSSPLGQAAEYVLNIQAGAEKAVAATKTYTAELMAVAMLSAGLGSKREMWDELARVPEWQRQALALDEAIAKAVQRYRYMRQAVVIGRGYSYATVSEWALKLKELTYVLAEPYSSASFMHGPIALVDEGFPVLAVAPRGKVLGPVLETLKLVRAQRGELVVISNDRRALALAQTPLPIASEVPEWLSPLVAVVLGQLFAYHLTLAKGYDVEQPRATHKVTETR